MSDLHVPVVLKTRKKHAFFSLWCLVYRYDSGQFLSIARHICTAKKKLHNQTKKRSCILIHSLVSINIPGKEVCWSLALEPARQLIFFIASWIIWFANYPLWIGQLKEKKIINEREKKYLKADMKPIARVCKLWIFNPLTPKIWLLILPSSCYTFLCKLVARI